MDVNHPTRFGPVASALVALSAVTLAGCGFNSGTWISSGTSTVALAAYSAQDDSTLSSREIHATFDAPDDGPLFLFNIAGAVTLEMTDGDEVIVEGTLYARGTDDAHTERLLESIEWTTMSSFHDHTWHLLEFPTEEYDGFHYPPFGEGSRTSHTHNDVSFNLYGDWAENRPTLFADLTIAYPRSIPLHVRTVAGHVEGGSLAGSLEVGSGNGNVSIERFDGDLDVDSGSGNITLGSVEGDLTTDNGSGDVRVASVKGNTVSCDTGSGNITFEALECESFDADLGSGDITLRNGEADTISVDSGSGRVEVHEVEFREFDADASSGDVVIVSSLAHADHITIDTGFGTVTIEAGADASFTIRCEFGSGHLDVGYDDADVRRRNGHVYAARRGDGRTRIDIDASSGLCTITPGG